MEKEYGIEKVVNHPNQTPAYHRTITVLGSDNIAKQASRELALEMTNPSIGIYVNYFER